MTMRKFANAVLVFAATAIVLPLLALALPFVTAVWAWNETED